MGELNMADALDVAVVRSKGSVDIAVSGEIDIATVGRFRLALTNSVLDSPGAVNVDLLGVTFIGSVGINALIHVRQLASTNGVTFRIVKASRRVESVLELMGLSDRFQ
jgi:anti-anti-sigma factor